MSIGKKNESWRSEEFSMIPKSDDDDDDEGLIGSPEFDDEEPDKLPMTNPALLDFKTWKNTVNGLIRSENHVLMENDEKLRAAIHRAMFLETASENLLAKRKRQIEMLDAFRGVEGVAAKKLFVDVKPILQRELGAGYEELEKNFTKSFTKSSQPLWTPPDISRPPPPIAAPTPPARYIAPFVVPPRLPFQPSPTISLMSQHLVPPPVITDFSRSDENSKPVVDKTLNTSWRRPYHPTPIPPPSPFVVPISQPPRPPPKRRSFGAADKGNLSPPGLVGVNVHGLFVGDRRVSSFRKSSRR